jgi:hypothetical protein
MTKLMPLLVVAFVGCRHVPRGPLVVEAGEDSQTPCVDRLVARTRAAGYLETELDRQGGFIRLEVRPRKARPGTFFGSYVTVQCAPNGLTATLAATAGDTRKTSRWVRESVLEVARVLDGF